jgi:lipopolysaccharide transport system permease protein
MALAERAAHRGPALDWQSEELAQKSMSVSEVTELRSGSSAAAPEEATWPAAHSAAERQTGESVPGASAIESRREKVIIEPGGADRLYWQDLWRYRELFYILAWRDLSVRYKQTSIGIAWAVLQPLLTMLVMTVVFGLVARLPSEGNAPYALLVFAGMLPWQFFASALSAASQSMLGSANLISKVYFPRMIIPAGAVITSFVDLLIGFVLLLGMMVWYQYWPNWRIVALPLFMAMAFLAALGPGLLLTALNVKYRDFRYVIPFLVQFGLYVSPVGYSSALIRERFGDTVFAIYSLNPMVGIIDGFRWAILGEAATMHWLSLAVSSAAILFFLAVGVWYFRKTERTFADVI